MILKSKWTVAAIVFGLAAAYLQWVLWFSDNSVASLSQTRTALNAEKRSNEDRRIRNDNLAAEVIDLKSGEETMEERARMELGLIKEGETFYKLVDLDTGQRETGQ